MMMLKIFWQNVGGWRMAFGGFQLFLVYWFTSSQVHKFSS